MWLCKSPIFPIIVSVFAFKALPWPSFHITSLQKYLPLRFSHGPPFILSLHKPYEFGIITTHQFTFNSGSVNSAFEFQIKKILFSMIQWSHKLFWALGPLKSTSGCLGIELIQKITMQILNKLPHFFYQ